MFGRHHKDNEEKQIDSSYSDSTYAEGGRDPYEKSSNYNKNSTGYSDSTYSEGGRGSYEKSSAYDTNTGYSEGGGRGRQGYENTTGYGSGGGYEKSSYSTDEPSSYEKKSSNYSETGIGSDASQVDYEKEEKHHSKLEHLGELGTAAAGAFGLHEKDRAEKDPEHGHKHKTEEEVAGAAAVGSGGYAFHEHHEKKEAKEEEEEAHGKKHHHIF